MKPLKRTSNQKGFTILELLIATMVFSVIFLGVTTALVQMSKLYYKGVVSGRTQETTRGVTDRISQQLQFTNDKFTPKTTRTTVISGTSLEFNAICIGSTRYSFILNGQVKNGLNGAYDQANSRIAHALWRDTDATGNCQAVNLNDDVPSATGDEMLGENMRLSDFNVTCDASGVCSVAIGVIYGDNDLIKFSSGTPVQAIRCESSIGSQWCAASKFSVTVLKRVRD